MILAGYKKVFVDENEYLKPPPLKLIVGGWCSENELKDQIEAQAVCRCSAVKIGTLKDIHTGAPMGRVAEIEMASELGVSTLKRNVLAYEHRATDTLWWCTFREMTLRHAYLLTV